MTAIHSDWGDWLPQEIAAAEPTGVTLWYLGCNGFVLKTAGDTTVFIDPYLGTGDPPRTVRMIPVPFDPVDVQHADAVLATHEHTDHVHGPSQAPMLAETDSTFYGPDASIDATADWTDEYAVAESQFERVGTGQTFTIGDLTISVEPANDPDAVDPVSYVFEHEAGTFVHGGDARPGAFETVGEKYDIDLGALAFGSVGMIPDKETREPNETKWYNDENMLIEAANELQLDRLVPTHWDMWRGLTAEPTAVYDHARSFTYPRAVDIVEIGDQLTL